MELSKQTSNQELSLRLKELGVDQNIEHGCFAWVHDELHLVHNDNDTGWLLGNDYSTQFDESCGEPIEYVCAFTVAELGEMLPKEIVDGLTFKLQCYKSSEGWRCEYWSGFNGSRNFRLGADNYMPTLADAMGKSLIYLIENNLLAKNGDTV